MHDVIDAQEVVPLHVFSGGFGKRRKFPTVKVEKAAAGLGGMGESPRTSDTLSATN